MKEKDVENLLYETLNADKPGRGVLCRAETEMDAAAARETAFQKKPKNAFKRIFLSSKRGIAAFTACILLFVAIGIGLPAGIWLSNGGFDMLRTLSLLRNTKVDMDGVAAFGVLQADSADVKKPVVRGMSISAAKETGRPGTRALAAQAAAGEEEEDGDGGDGWEEWDWEKDYDWDPDKAQLLVKVSDDGEIEEVVYERTNGRGVVRQDKLGFVAGIYVGTEYTYIMYARDLPEWYLVQEIAYCGLHGFGSHHADYQTVIVHHATGRVFALKDLIPIVSETVGAKQYTLWASPFDGVLDVTILYNRRDENGNEIWPPFPSLHYRLRMDENMNLVYEDITQDEQIRNVKRDKYGNFFMLTRSTEKITGNMLFFTQKTPLYFGADRRVYSMEGDRLRVYNADFELEDVPAACETTLAEIWPLIDGHNSHMLPNGKSEPIASSGGDPGEVFILKNGYLFSMYGSVSKLCEDGRLEYIKQLEGRFPLTGEDGYIINGELIAMVTKNSADVIVHIDFSGFTEENPRAEIKEIIGADRIFCNGLYMIGQQGSEFTDDEKYFMVTVEDGKPVCEFYAYRDPAANGTLRAVQPVVAAQQLYAR